MYDLLGQVVGILRDEVEAAGERSATWNASALPSGVYFYRLEAISTTNPGKIFVQVKKTVLLK